MQVTDDLEQRKDKALSDFMAWNLEFEDAIILIKDLWGEIERIRSEQ